VGDEPGVFGIYTLFFRSMNQVVKRTYTSKLSTLRGHTKKTSQFSLGRFRVRWLSVPGYCPGLSNCVKPVVFTSRNSGVRGGNNDGFKKLLSNE
jgi:hypothetical protein